MIQRLVAFAVRMPLMVLSAAMFVALGGLYAYRQLNVEAYPASSNVYDSLGEAYMDDGNTGLAIVNYKKSLELDPNNTNAVEMLKKLSQLKR